MRARPSSPLAADSHLVAFQFQQRLQGFADGRFVVNDQHRTGGRSGSFAEVLRAMTAASDIDRLPRQREIEVERGAFAGSAFHPDLPGMFLDDAVGHRQAQPGASGLPFAGTSWW